jgi:hypothetical protein
VVLVGVMAKSITSRATACVLGTGAPVEVAEMIRLYGPLGVVVAVATVIITVAGFATVGLAVADGEKLHVTPGAGTLQESVTAPLKFPNAVT